MSFTFSIMITNAETCLQLDNFEEDQTYCNLQHCKYNNNHPIRWPGLKESDWLQVTSWCLQFLFSILTTTQNWPGQNFCQFKYYPALTSVRHWLVLHHFRMWDVCLNKSHSKRSINIRACFLVGRDLSSLYWTGSEIKCSGRKNPYFVYEVKIWEEGLDNLSIFLTTK